MRSQCENCGCNVYGGHCVNCHEETYIFDQNESNDESIDFSDEFIRKVEKQQAEAYTIRNKQNEN